MGCPLWESPPPKAKSKPRQIARQRQPLSSDYGVPRPPIRRRGQARDTPYFVAMSSREPPSYSATRRRIRQDRIVQNTLLETLGRGSGFNFRDDENPRQANGWHTSRALQREREREREREQDQSQSEGWPPTRGGLTQEPSREQYREQSREQRVPPADGFWQAMADWENSDGGREARAHLGDQLNSLWPHPARPHPQRDAGSADAGSADAGSADAEGNANSRGSEQPALDSAPPLPPVGDPRRVFVAQARRLHDLVVGSGFRPRDQAYRDLLRNQSAIALRAERDHRAGLITWEQAEHPIEVYRELLRLAPDHMESVFPGRDPLPLNSNDGQNNGEEESEPAPSSQPDAPANPIDGLGDRNRSLSPESDDVWDTLLSTLTPDPQPPSVGSSFASAAASQNTGNTSQTDLTRLSDIFAEHQGDHECDGSCLFCPGDHDLTDGSDTEADIEYDTEAEVRERRRRTQHQARLTHEILIRERARIAALATRFNLHQVDM